MVNFLALLGWSPGAGDQEVFTRDELVTRFSLEGISGGNTVFNPEKLAWFNQQHIARLSPSVLVSRLQSTLDDAGLWLARRTGETTWCRAQRASGRGILRSAPRLMKALAVAGTAAMFLVGGGILTHGVPLLHHLVEDFGEEAADIPALGAIIGPLVPMLLNAIAGIVAGAVAFAVVSGVRRLRARGGAAT